MNGTICNLKTVLFQKLSAKHLNQVAQYKGLKLAFCKLLQKRVLKSRFHKQCTTDKIQNVRDLHNIPNAILLKMWRGKQNSTIQIWWPIPKVADF